MKSSITYLDKNMTEKINPPSILWGRRWAEVLYTARQKARRETDHKITTTRSCWQLQPLKPTRKPFKAVELIALHLSQLHPSTCLSTHSRKKMKKKPRDSPHLIPLLIDLNSLCSIIKCDS
ncbi:hypothetical protein SAY87_014593 [Trapa incisa]|uniref:Uncharacterized protein n=1 Tax=Trapa incisa TaxID=236973 RepID=A0AAN7GWE1_9MYRT|nr:hypothetical protein SAY87_014593 [Trapa incisa]